MRASLFGPPRAVRERVLSSTRATSLSLLLLACGGPAATDAGVVPMDDAGVQVDAGSPPVPPADPLPPMLPCPEGWQASVEGEPGCAPWPEHDGATCPLGEARFPGDAACAPLGAACPTGAWPDDLQARSDVIFVLADATPGGDGSLAAPFSTLRAALDAATATQTIALGKGTYVEAVTLSRSAIVRGACVAETILQAPPGLLAAGGFQVRGASTEVSVSSLSLMQSSVLALDGALVTIEDIWIHEATQFAVVASLDARVTGSGLLVDATVADPSSGIGAGLFVLSAGAVEMDRVHIDSSSRYGIIANNTGSRVALTRAAVRRTVNGVGVAVDPGAEVSLERSVIERSEGTGAWVHVAQLSLTDVTIRQTVPEVPNEPGGTAMVVTGGAQVTLQRVVLEGAELAGVGVFDTGTELVATDLVVRDLVGQFATGGGGFGLWAAESGGMTVERVLVIRARSAGVVVTDPGSLATVTDIQVMDTRSQAIDDRVGRGISVEEMGALTVTRGRLTRNRESALNVETGGVAMLTDVTIEQTLSELSDLSMGRGITVHSGSRLAGVRVALLDNREASILVAGEGTTAQLSDLIVRGTQPNECSPICPIGPGGTGVAVVDGAVFEMHSFSVTNNALIGCQVAFAQATFMNGEIAENPIGINLQVEGELDLTALSQGVVFRDNGVNLDSTDLPIPDVISPL